MPLYSRKFFEETLMNIKRAGSSLVEVLICSILASAVLLGVLELSTAAVKLVQITQEQRERISSLSAIIAQTGAGIPSADVGLKPGWVVSMEPLEYPESRSLERTIHVSVSGRIRASLIDISWKEWDIRCGE
jgi:Tfp pilus assembly protein PilV